MHGVVRFLDTELLPASAPEDYPKVIKSGIDEESQHRKSPAITGPCGIATLLHRIGRPELLERLLDDAGTPEYYLRVYSDQNYINDVYVIRRGYNVEIGFINSNGEWAQHGVRYLIEHEDGSPYRVGKWTPLSTSDLNSDWGGSDIWVRAQGAAVAKAIWFHKHFDRERIEVSWSGITVAGKAELEAWMQERAARLAEKRKIRTQEYEARKAQYGEEHHRIEAEMGMRNHYKSRLVCRADCGEQEPKLKCSKCKVAYYCSAACQREDWQYHKTYCGTETPIPSQFL